MLARCPACQTVFRVRPEQLRTHAGQVRCGHCLNAFDALDNLLEEGAPPPTPQRDATQPKAAVSRPGPTTPALEPSEPERSASEPVAPQPPAPEVFRGRTAARPVDLDLTELAPIESKEPSERFFVLEERIAEPRVDVPAGPPELDFDIPETLIPFRRRGAPPPPPPEPSRRELDDAPVFEPIEFIEPPPPAGASEIPTKVADLEMGLPEPATVGHAIETGHAAQEPPPTPLDWPHEPSDRMEPRLSTASDEPAHPVQPEPAFSALPTGDDVGEDGGRGRDPVAATPRAEIADDDYAAPAPSTARRSLVGLGIGVLAGTIAMQSAYIFRDELAREWPALRPALLAACTRLSCTISLPRVAAEISVDASDLQSEPHRPGRYTLSATVRNRAHYAQAYPHLELTLTDARDQALARRVLAPEDWTPGADFERGLPAGREITINLPFEATGLSAAGYRIYVFYP